MMMHGQALARSYRELPSLFTCSKPCTFLTASYIFSYLEITGSVQWEPNEFDYCRYCKPRNLHDAENKDDTPPTFSPPIPSALDRLVHHPFPVDRSEKLLTIFWISCCSSVRRCSKNQILEEKNSVHFCIMSENVILYWKTHRWDWEIWGNFPHHT
jgi:hypothetical protein